MSKNNESKIICFPSQDNHLGNKSIKTEYSIHLYIGEDPELYNNRHFIDGIFDNLAEARGEFKDFFTITEDDIDVDYDAEIEFFERECGHVIEKLSGVELIETTYDNVNVINRKIIDSWKSETKNRNS